MRTLLVLAQHPGVSEAVQAAVSADEYRVLHCTSLVDAEPLLVHGVVDACICDLELTTVQPIWLLEKLRRFAPKCPLIVFVGSKQPEWEEEAYLKGAAHVLSKPVRPRSLAALLNRLWTEPQK